jgi:hypothetical protein
MTANELLQALRVAGGVAEADTALGEFERTQETKWVPFGRENNRGTIEVSADPTRSCIERITNGVDGVLELEHERHGGLPDCRSPKEAAVAWLGVPDSGLSAMSQAERRRLAQRISVTLEPGEGKESRILTIRDNGIGITPGNMPLTILSLNQSNKISKHYLVGAYGQGGSSTFTFSRLSLIACRYADRPIGFTLVKFLDLPAEQFKIGHYVCMVMADGTIPEAFLDISEFVRGTEVRHFGYDLNNYGSPLGPNSLYGSMNTNLFDPVMPVWFDNRVHNYRRVIKGSRNALCGAVDDGDERTGPALSHSIPAYSVSLGDFGRIGIEYWVLQQPTKENKKPNAAFVNPTKPIVLTLNGQNQGEFSHLLIRKEAELPFLGQRLIAHVDCNSLSATSKRHLFVSNRESQRDVKVREMIHQELIKAFRSDDVLKRLNDEARQQGMRQQDESAMQYMRNEVARLLRLQGVELGSPVGGAPSGTDGQETKPAPAPRPRPAPQAIELHEPPPYIRFVSDEEREITFYSEQRKYVRIETDANSTYHDPNDPHRSNINIIVDSDLALRGSTALKDGRMRAIIEGLNSSQQGNTGTIRVELKRPGLAVLIDERRYRIVEAPKAKPAERQVSVPPFRAERVEGPDDQTWTQLGWPDNVNAIASQAQMEDGTLVVYYSAVFPKYARQLTLLEGRNIDLGASFTSRYEIWLIVHSLLKYQDDQLAAGSRANQYGTDSEIAPIQDESEVDEIKEREERCRIAIMSTMFAAREIQLDTPKAGVTEE